MPEGSLHRPMVSVGCDEQGVSRRRRTYYVRREKIFDNPVDCTRQPENEKQVKDEARGSDPTRFACEGPLRGAGVRAVVPGRLASAVRRP